MGHRMRAAILGGMCAQMDMVSIIAVLRARAEDLQLCPAGLISKQGECRADSAMVLRCLRDDSAKTPRRPRADRARTKHLCALQTRLQSNRQTTPRIVNTQANHLMCACVGVAIRLPHRPPESADANIKRKRLGVAHSISQSLTMPRTKLPL